MSILDEALAERKVNDSRCAMRRVLDALSAEDRSEVESILFERPDIQGSAITRVLNKRGHDIKQGSVTRHRRGECCCERSSR